MVDNGTGDGWVLYNPPDGATGLHIRYARDESERWVITDLYLHGDALTGDMLRGISLSRMEAWQNREPQSSEALTRLAQGAPDPGSAVDDGLTVAELRRRAEAHRDHRAEILSGFLQVGSAVETLQQVEKLERPDGSDPERFYRQVALAYRQFAAESKAPARAIAEEAEVPVTTAHRWIREARRRGFLPPGRKGRVG